MSFPCKTIVTAMLALCCTGALVALDYPAYDLRPGQEFFRYRPYEEIRPLINETGTGHFTRLDGILHYWRPTVPRVHVWPSREVVFTAPADVARIEGLIMHPVHGAVVVAELHSGTAVFHALKSGLRITAWGSFHKAGGVRKWRDRFVLAAAERWDRWFYVDMATGRRIEKWGVHERIGPLLEAAGRYYLRVFDAGKGWTWLDAATGRAPGGYHSYMEDTVSRVGNRFLYMARTGTTESGLYDLATGERVHGPFKLMKAPLVTRTRTVFFGMRDREWELFDAADGRMLASGIKGIESPLQAGGRSFIRIEADGKPAFLDLDSLKRYGTGYDRLKYLQQHGDRFYCQGEREGLWYYIDLDTGRPTGQGWRLIYGVPQQAGNDFYYIALLPGEGEPRTCHVNLKTGRSRGGIHAGRVRELQQTAAGWVFSVAAPRGQYYYVDLASGRRIGEVYPELGNVQRAGARSLFFVRTADRQYWIIDAVAGKAVHGPFASLSLNRNLEQVGSRHVFEARQERQSGYFDLATGKPVWGLYSGFVQGPYLLGGQVVFKARDDRREAWIDTATGRPLGGWFDAVERPQLLGKRWVFLARSRGKATFHNFRDGAALWGPFDNVGSPKDLIRTTVFFARIGRYNDPDRKEFYIDTATGRPWIGQFNEVKEIRIDKGVVTFQARTGDTWTTIHPFKFVEYSGMKFTAGAKKLYPSRMQARGTEGRVMGTVELRNPFTEPITVRLELSSPSFPAFYGQASSILGANVKIAPGQTLRQQLLLPFSEKYWSLFKEQVINCALSAAIRTEGGQESGQRIDLNVTVASRDRMQWDDIRNVAAYANVDDPVVKELARVIKELGVVRNWQVPPRIDLPLKAYETIRALGLNYSFMSLGLGDEDTVKMPHEIVREKLGKCTDTTILYATLLSRLGFSTIITTFTYSQGNRRISHLMLLVDTGVEAKDAQFLARAAGMLAVPKGMTRCYIPIETTGMVSEDGKSLDFLAAWQRGLAQFRQHEAQILDPKNSFRLQSAWEGGFPPMNPAVGDAFAFPEARLHALKSVLRDQQHRYVGGMLEDPQLEARLKSAAADHAGKMALGKYYYRVRRYSDAGAAFAAALALQPADLEARYLHLSTVVYAKAADDPRITPAERQAAERDFPVLARRFGDLLAVAGRESKSGEHYAMNYDLGKWYNAFEEGSKNGARHIALAKEIQARIDRARALRWSADGLAALRKKGYTPGALTVLQQKGFSEQLVLSLATKGFSEQLVLSLATKGFSEQMVLSLATKGFSEQMVLSLATKGFSEQMVLSLAVKGQAEEAWGISR